MRYEYGKKFQIVDATLMCEILGCFPSKQTVLINGNSYRLLVNGIEMTISEDNLDHFIRAGKQPEVVEESVQPLLSEVVEESVQPLLFVTTEDPMVNKILLDEEEAVEHKEKAVKKRVSKKK